jgi:3-dehydroquinate dehydratase-1
MSEKIKIKGYEIGERPLICVPVVARTKEEIIGQIQRLSDEHAQMIEWRVDWYEGVEDLQGVLDLARKLGGICRESVLLVTYRSKNQGGEGTLDDRKRDELLVCLAREQSVDLIDVELFEHEYPEILVHMLQDEGGVLVASHHNFVKTPTAQEMETILSTMQASGADIVKLAVMPKRREDVANLLLATARFKDEHPDTPLITMSMGSLGVISRVAGESFGSCVTFGADEKASAPGQMGKKDLATVLELLHRSITGVE